MKKIFISYRRDDEPFATKILYDKLAAYFGSDEIFYDIGDIPKGAHFLELIEQSISECGAAIAIIGSKWLTLTGDDGQPRLSNPNDMVRFELEAALRRKIPILPILINDAKMPHPDAVPQSLREICFLQDHHVHSNDQFDREVSEVIQFLIEKLRQPANLTDVIMPDRGTGVLTGALGLLAGTQLNGIDMVNASDGWIVGSQGTILRLTARDGWVKIEPLVHTSLTKVRALSTSSAWIVGEAGVILRYDERGWAQVTSGTSHHLLSLYMFNEQDGWAVGEEGTILRCQNRVWTDFPSPFKKALHCITMLSPQHGWAAGAEGVILEYDGIAWKQITQLDLDMIEDMVMLNESSGWIVGHKSSYEPDEPDQSEDKSAVPPRTFIRRLAKAARDAYAAVSNFAGDLSPIGEIFVYNAGKWERENIPRCSALIAIKMVVPDEGWAVGGNVLGGVILRRQNGNWVELYNPAHGHLGAVLHDVAVVSDVKSWAVGGSGMILQYDWNTWKLHTSLHIDSGQSETSTS